MSTDLKNSPVPLAEISQGPNAFEDFLDRNQKNLVVFALLIALAGVAFVVYRGIHKSNEETAGLALVKSKDAASLQKLVDEFPKTTAAGSALLLLGNKQWDDSQQDAGIATLQKLITEHPTHPTLPAAQASLASKLMTQGKTAEASKLFETLSKNPAASYLAPFALISLGDLAKAGGDLTNAEDYYSQVKSKFPDSPFAQSSASRMADLRAKAPAEIEPPPAPPAAAPAAGTPSASSAPVITPELTTPELTTPDLTTPAPAPETSTPADLPVEPELPAAPDAPATPQP